VLDFVARADAERGSLLDRCEGRVCRVSICALVGRGYSNRFPGGG